MEEKKLNHQPHVGPKPVEAEPNHVREKTYEAPETPAKVQAEKDKTPYSGAREKISDEMDDAVDEVEKRL